MTIYCDFYVTAFRSPPLSHPHNWCQRSSWKPRRWTSAAWRFNSLHSKSQEFVSAKARSFVYLHSQPPKSLFPWHSSLPWLMEGDHSAEKWVGQRLYPAQLQRLREDEEEVIPKHEVKTQLAAIMVQSTGGKKQHLRLARGKDRHSSSREGATKSWASPRREMWTHQNTNWLVMHWFSLVLEWWG